MKSKNIAYLGNQVRLSDERIEVVKNLDNLPFAEILMYNGSGDRKTLIVYSELRKPLMEFLTDYYEEQKEILYDKIKEELSK
jgi:hypothetical protein